MPGNRLCELLGIDYPIIQAGMVWVSDWRLAAAASNAGILGTIGTGAMRDDALEENIRNALAATDRPFAVNIPLLRPDAEKKAEMALDFGASVFITSAGNPARIVPLLKRPGVTLLHVVPSVKGALKAQKEGVDVVICEGYEAGGHDSPLETTTLALVPQVADAVDIPVVAAGGIADGRGMAAAMALGADGVQIGTRFIATAECNAHENYKKAVVEAGDGGTSIVGRSFIMLRVLNNDFAMRMKEAEKSGAGVQELRDLLRSEGSRNISGMIEGDTVEGTLQAGQSAALVKDIVPVAELVGRLVREYETARKSLRPLEEGTGG